MHAFFIAREQKRRERLRPRGCRKHLVADDALVHEPADRLECALLARCLAIVLHEPRGEACSFRAVDKARPRERRASDRDLLGREDIADDQLHEGSSWPLLESFKTNALLDAQDV